MHLKYLLTKKRASQGLIYKKRAKNVQKRAKTCKNVHLKCFWILFKNVHCQGPCILRPCISRPYCRKKYFSGSQLWKLDDSNLLQNKDKNWVSNEEWVFKPDTNLIQNILTEKVLGATNDGQVIREDYEEGKDQQLWKKGDPNTEGYFTLKNFREPKLMTAISTNDLQIKGNINHKWIVN